MALFASPFFDGHEQVMFAHDPESGFRAIVAIHNSVRGPALGGCRMWPYPDEEAALSDVLRLSRGMTYKAAMARLPLGGGKSVVLGDPRHDKSDALWRWFGGVVDTLGGRYVVAEDVGTDVADMQEIARATSHVAGLPQLGGGDPSPATAQGVFEGMRVAARHALRRHDLEGLVVAVQGLGHVGMHLCERLHDAGAELVVSDLDEARVALARERFGARAVAPDAILATEADILAPCALGAILDDASIPKIRARVVAGSANNQLAGDRHGDMLRQRGVTYVPDYAINAGGLIHIHHERLGYDAEAVRRDIAGIGATVAEILERADRAAISTNLATDLIAEARFKRRRPDAA